MSKNVKGTKTKDEEKSDKSSSKKSDQKSTGSTSKPKCITNKEGPQGANTCPNKCRCQGCCKNTNTCTKCHICIPKVPPVSDSKRPSYKPLIVKAKSTPVNATDNECSSTPGVSKAEVSNNCPMCTLDKFPKDCKKVTPCPKASMPFYDYKADVKARLDKAKAKKLQPECISQDKERCTCEKKCCFCQKRKEALAGKEETTAKPVAVAVKRTDVKKPEDKKPEAGQAGGKKEPLFKRMERIAKEHVEEADRKKLEEQNKAGQPKSPGAPNP